MRVMITGAAGLLAAAVRQEFARHAELSPFDRHALDLTDGAAVEKTVARVAPHVLINCAAFNDVDGAEDRAVDALRANTFAVLWLARASRAAGARFVHYSTDFVFDGTGTRPYAEDDPPGPRSVYGCSKLLGDWVALEEPKAYVLRVESLFGKPASPDGRRGSLGLIVERIRAGQEVPVFVDSDGLTELHDGCGACDARAPRARRPIRPVSLREFGFCELGGGRRGSRAHPGAAAAREAVDAGQRRAEGPSPSLLRAFEREARARRCGDARVARRAREVPREILDLPLRESLLHQPRDARADGQARGEPGRIDACGVHEPRHLRIGPDHEVRESF